MQAWEKFVPLSEEALARCDIVQTNLACVDGLPGWEKVCVSSVVGRVNAMAEGVQQETEQRLPHFRRTGYDSEAQWRVSLMIRLLWRDYGVRYNTEKIDLNVPLDVEDSFLHGIILGKGGSCASLPILYAAVGRRLGYPIKLATVQDPRRRVGHCFARWEGSNGECFNIDSLDGRFCCAPDDWYREEYQVTPEAEQQLGSLKSLTPRHELADFLLNRAFCWQQLGNHRQAAFALIPRCFLKPLPGSINDLAVFLNRWHDFLRQVRPPVMPELTIYLPDQQFPAVPEGLERLFFHINALDLVLQNPEYSNRWWRRMRSQPGYLPADLPGHIVVRYRSDGVAMDFYKQTDAQTRAWHELWRSFHTGAPGKNW